jgi:carbon storage regulator
MLVISRKPGERVHIGEEIQVAILEITGSRVVVGIAAPREIAIRRVGPNGEQSAPRKEPVEAEGVVDLPQPEIEFEFREMEPEERPAGPRRVPVVKVKRSRLKSIPAEALTALG